MKNREKTSGISMLLRTGMLLMMVALMCSTSAVALNAPPVAGDDDNYGYEGTTLTGNLALNDSDPDGDLLTYSVVGNVANGTMTLSASGSYTFVPSPEFNGFIYITYQVCDPYGLCDTGVLELAFLFVNDIPQANNDTYFAFLNTPLTGNVSLNDVELDDEINWWNVLSQPANGTLTMNNTGAFTYTPNTGYLGQDMFVYQACDPCGACDFAFVYITVTEPNEPPVAVNDDVFTAEDMILNGNVALNDTDPENDVLEFSITTGPEHGEITFNSNGTFTYIPDLNFFGWDGFQYEVCDEFGNCDQAEVTIEVFFVNDVPDAVNDTVYTNENQMIMGNVALNDIDFDLEYHFYSAIYGPYNGNIVMEEAGAFVYTPNPSWNGVDVVGYLMIDPCGTMDFAELYIYVQPVNDPPVAVGETYNGTEDTVLSGTLAGNDTDVEGSPLTYSLVSPPASGTLVLNPNGTFTFTPITNFNGTLTAQYAVTDNLNESGYATLTMIIASVNDMPVVVDDVFEIMENTSVGGDVSDNDTDADGDVLTYGFNAGNPNGNFSWNANGSFSYTPNSNYFGTVTINYSACDPFGACDLGVLTILVDSINDWPVAQDDDLFCYEDTPFNSSVNDNDYDPEGMPLTYTVLAQPEQGVVTMQTNGDFTYIPEPEFNGFITFTYTACDPLGACDIAEVTIEVLFVNDPPVPVNDAFTMNEDAVLFEFVGANDVEPENEFVYFVQISNPASGSLQFNSDGTFTYTPNPNYSGTVNFNYLMCDPCGACALANCSITVLPVNDAPVAQNDMFIMDEDGVLNASVAGNDSDFEVGPLSWSLTSAPVNGAITFSPNGSFSYTPNLNFNGQEVLTYTVSDAQGLSDPATITITITAHNDLPVAVDDSFSGNEDEVVTGNIGVNDSDIENDPLSFSLISSNAAGTLVIQANGDFTFTPAPNWNGTVNYNYLVCDTWSACDGGVLTITLQAFNDAPVASSENVAMLMNTVLTGNLALNDSDPDGDVLTYSVMQAPLNGGIALNANGTFTYLPNENFYGEDVVVYMACDGEFCASAVLYITIANTNSDPVAEDDIFVTSEDLAVSGSVSLNDFDADGNALAFEMLGGPEEGICVLNNTGQFTYTPPANYHGTVQFTYRVCDIFNSCVEAVVTIEVISVNDPPYASGELISLMEDAIEVNSVSGNDGDVDDTDLTYTLLSPTQYGSITLEADGSFTYIPEWNFFGDDTFTYEICDPQGSCAQATTTLAVLFVNDLPEVEDEWVSTEMNVVLNGDVSVNDIELDPEELLYYIVNGPLNGGIYMQTDGTFTYTPNDGFVGTEVISYMACDPCGACDGGVLTIEVTETNTAPFAFDWSSEICQYTGSFAIDLTTISGDSESADGELTYSLVDSENTSIQLIGSVLTGEAFPESGVIEVTYSVCDNSFVPLCAEAVVTIAIQETYIPVITGFNMTPVTCYGALNGMAEVMVENEGYNLFYQWNVDQNTALAVYLEPGTYTVTVSSDASCGMSSSAEVVVEGAESPLAIEGLTGLPINDNPGGSGTYTIVGGQEPYSYEWYDSEGNLVSESMELGPLTDASQQGTYFLTVTDGFGCSVTQSITITDVVEHPFSSFNCFPNPVADQLHFEISPPMDGTLLRISDAAGRLVQEYRLNSGQTLHITDVSALSPGVYVVQIGMHRSQFVKQ